MELCNLSQAQGREFCSWCLRTCLFVESNNALLNILHNIDVVIAHNTGHNNSELFNIMMENKKHQKGCNIQDLAIAAGEYVYLTSMLELGYSCYIEQITYYLQKVISSTSLILKIREKDVLGKFLNHKKIEQECKTIYNLKMHESMTVETNKDIDLTAMRVHNGWIYRESLTNGHVVSTFVPDKENDND